MLLKTLKAFSELWRYPEARDYLRMGYGIEARYRRCAKYWNKHIELCCRFQQQALRNLPAGGAIAVLGAGRLYDLALQDVLQKFARIDLFDRDPSAQSTWSKLRRLLAPQQQLNFSIADLSASIQSWSNELRFFLKNNGKNEIDALAAFLTELQPKEAPRLDRYKAIFSINLLGQISIYWRDRVFSYLSDFWGLDTDEHGKYQAVLQEAIELTQRRLEQQHLDLLCNSEASLIVIIGDRYYHYYQQDKSAWQTEAALFIGSSELALPGYDNFLSDSWLWHIAPQGIEQAEHGVIHEVFAQALSSLRTF